MLSRFKEVLTKIAGNVNGYHKELQWASRKIAKDEITGGIKRQIHFGVRGDVAVDYGGGFGAAMQSKSCFAAPYADVDNHIQKAAVQLTGDLLAQETPAVTDRRIVDISIKNPNNRWPKTDANLTPLTLKNIVDRIHHQVSTYVQNKRGYNKWNQLSKLGSVVGGTPNKPISRVNWIDPSFGPQFGIDFVVKIRWDHARQVNMPNGATLNIVQVTTRSQLNTMNNIVTECILYKTG